MIGIIFIFADDDPLEGISNRLEEVQSMVKPAEEFSTFLKELPQEQQESIMVRSDTDLDFKLWPFSNNTKNIISLHVWI